MDLLELGVGGHLIIATCAIITSVGVMILFAKNKVK